MTINVEIRKSCKCNEEFSMFLAFDYDASVVDAVRDFPTRYWNKDTKEWELPLNKLGQLVDKLTWCEFNISGQYVEMQKKEVAVPTDFAFKTTPFQHQVEGFNFGLQNDRWLLGDEQGLGKTKQVIDIAVAKKLEQNFQHCLIICGVNGLKWNWVNEVHTHSNEEAYILGQKMTRNKITIGSTKDRLDDLNRLADIPAYFIITNIESLRDEAITSKITELCNKGIIGVVAADEVHKMKNPTSQQGKGFLKIQSEVRIAMTGTPLMNNPFDLYIILKWLGYEKHTFNAFKHHYGEFGGYGGYECIGYKHLDELQERLNDIMLRRLKKNVLDLPEKLYVDEYVEMTAKQEQIYKEVSADIMANIDQIKMDNNPLAQLIRLRQATGYTGILSSTITESAKLDRMEELVADAVENDKKVVVFSNWTQITHEVEKRLRNYRPAVITGETNDSDRQAMVDKFQNDDKCKVIIGTTGAMGTGLNLFKGTIIIFVDHPWSRAIYDQCVDRCHRIGQKENITVYNILCRNTIDERIWSIVNQKGALSDMLIDKVDKLEKDKLIDFLLS